MQCRRWNREHTYGYKKVCSHDNSLFSSPHPLDFNMLVIFSLKNVKQGNKTELTYLPMFGGSCMWTAREALNIWEVWNPVCCHGNRTVKLVLWNSLWNTFRRIYCKESNISVTNGLRKIIFWPTRPSRAAIFMSRNAKIWKFKRALLQ